jgi:hypothetical protein
MSPPHEVKMTSLNQRVSDIQWKNSTARPFVDPEAAHAPEAEMADDAATQHDDDMADAESLKRRSTDSMRSLKRARDAALADDGGRQAKRQSPVDEPEVTPVEAHAPLGKKKSDESIRSIKRHRDEADADANPRETKRPTPPAEEDPKKTPPPTAAHQPMVVSPPATTPKFVIHFCSIQTLSITELLAGWDRIRSLCGSTLAVLGRQRSECLRQLQLLRLER